jgi:hypothetical protein
MLKIRWFAGFESAAFTCPIGREKCFSTDATVALVNRHRATERLCEQAPLAEFSITLRRGADGMLKDLGDALDLRLRGVIGKGGLYARGGFTAPVAGGDFEQKTVNWKESFPKITDYTIK